MSRIKPNPHQPRRSFPEDELKELADSISEHGVLQPLLLKATGSGYELVSGERRLRASQLAGLSDVPAILINPEDEKGSLTIALVENVQRADLGAIELARAYRQLQEQFEVTQEEIASTVGKSRPHVANTLRLLDLPEEIQEAVNEGTITAGHARALLMAPPEVRDLLFRRMIKDGISVRQAEKAASRLKPVVKAVGREEDASAGDPDLDHMLNEMTKGLESALGRKCIIKRTAKGSGKVTLEFYSDSDLRGLVEKICRK